MGKEFLNDLNIHGAGQIQFKTTAGANAGKIDQDGNNLVLTNAVGDILLGDGAADVYIGDGTNNVDILFEQSGNIKADDSASNVTLTLGSSNTTLNLVSPTITGSLTLPATTINNKLTFTTANGYILFDYEPSGDTGEYSTEVPLLKVDLNGSETTILSRVSEYRGVALGADDTVWLRAGDTGSVIKTNVGLTAEVVLMSAEQGFHAYAFPNNDTTWSNRNEFRFYGGSATASDNGLYIGDGGNTQFIDLNRNLKNIGTVTASGKISGGEIEGTSLDINGTSDVSGNAVFHGKSSFGATTSNVYNVHAKGTGWAGDGIAIEATTTNGAVLSLFNTDRHFQIASRGSTLDFRDITDSDTRRFYVDSTGNLQPGADSSYSLGTNSNRWANVYADTLYGDGSNITGVTASNADTVDNLHAASFLRSDTADTATGKITLEGNSAAWDTSTPGTTTGSLHFDPGVTTDNFGNAITFGASDSSNGTTAQAGIYLRTDGNYGSRMYFATTDSYAHGSKVAMYINHNKDVYFLDNINVAGDIVVSGTVDGVDIATLASNNTGTNTGDQDLSGLAAASHTHAAGDITSGTLAVARGGTGLTANTTYINSNAFANFTTTTSDYNTITTRGLYRFQGGSNGPAGSSHTTGLTLTENSGNYGWQMTSNSSSDNVEGLYYRYRGTSWGPWQTLVTKTFGDGRYGKIASPTFTGTPAAPTAAAGTNTTQIATTAFVSTAVSNLVDSAPGTLDTLNELAAALGDDANFSTTVTNSIATKMPKSGGTFTGSVTFADRILNTYTGTSYHELQNATTNGTILRLTSTGDSKTLTLQSDHVYSNGSFYLGDNSYQTNFRGSSYSFSTGNATFAADVTIGDDLNISGNELTFTNDAASAYIRAADALLIQSDYNTGENKPIYLQPSAVTELKIETGLSTFTGDVTVSGGNLEIDSTMSSSPTSIIYLDVDGSNINGGGGSIIFSTSATSGSLTNYNAQIRGVRAAGGSGGDSQLEFLTTLVSDQVAPKKRMVITKEGNVGIGTETPGYKLEIAEDTDGTANLLFLRNSDATYAQTWQFQSDTSKDLVITGSSGSGGIKFVPGSRGATFTSVIKTPDGTASAPAYSFSGDTDTGIFKNVYSGSNMQLNITVDGTTRASFNSAGITSQANVYSGGTGEFRNYSGVWKATTGLTGNGFQFINSADGTAMTLSSTGNATFAGGVTATTINTGQGATEVYLMNQNVRTSDNVSFNRLTIEGTYPRIFLTDTNHNDDWSIINNDGSFGVYNDTDTSYALTIDGSNNATFAGSVVAPDVYAQNLYITSSGTSAVNRIDNDNNQLYITYGGTSNRALEISNSNGNATFAGDIILNDTKKLKLGNSGAETSIYSDGTDTYIQQTSGNLYLYQGATNKDIVFYCDEDDTDLEIARFDGSDQGLKFKDGKKIIMGDSGDIQIQSNNSNQLFDFYNLGNVLFRQHFLDGDMTFQSDDGSGGVTTYFKLDGGNVNVSVAKDFLFQDNVKAKFGNGGDLQIYHNGSNSYIQDGGTGGLILKSNSIKVNDDGDGNALFQVDASGDIGLKVETGTGNYIFGDSAALGTGNFLEVQGGDSFEFKLSDSGVSTTKYEINPASNFTRHKDDVQARFGDGDDLKIYHNASNSIIENNTGDLILKNNANDKDIIFQSDNGSGSTTTYFLLDGSIAPGTGSTFTRFPDNSRAVFGTASDLQIYHDGSNSYIEEIGTGDLIISGDNDVMIKDRSGNLLFNGNASNSVELYFGGSKKFETTGKGISVTGDIELTGNIENRSIPMVIHASFDDTTSSTSNLIIPLAGSITETTVSGASAPHFFIIPYACVLKKVIMKTVDGSISSSFTTELKAYKNGTVTFNSSSGELTHVSSSVSWTPTANSDITYAAGDKFSLVYQKSATFKYWQDVAVTIVFTLTDYDI